MFAATSEPVLTAAGKVQLFDNPRHLDNARRRLRKWERRMARRYVKGLPARRRSAGWREARDQVAHVKGLVAQRHASTQHLLSKQLVTQPAHVALEDLRVKNMTRTACGSVEKPGRNGAAKAGLNQAILDVAVVAADQVRAQVDPGGRTRTGGDRSVLGEQPVLA
ncbi:hypothetical protein ABZ565_03885 [Streptomyces sp. NPDC016469]|uniref:hypothetical protein n=1 Tax=Streptomyces sp. NPDC016469 TaxID=3157191 RepID=UPI0033CC9A0A